MEFNITPKGDGIMFVDHQKNDRSGHLGHALVEYEKNKLLAFYPNDCGDRNAGHNGYGWVEYKRSEDGGKTWSEPIELEYAKKLFDNKEACICCEKAILNDDGKIILFCHRTIHDTQKYGPLLVPTYIISSDNGVTWSEAKELGEFPGRIWDVIKKDGVIYLLMQREYHYMQYNDGDPCHILFKSYDGGETFERCVEITHDDGKKLFYGSMVFTPEGKLVVYIYQFNDEYNLLCFESDDEGKTFVEAEKSYCPQRIRNPQVIYFNGIYFLHGRSGDINPPPSHFVVYNSKDGKHWNEGEIIRICDGWGGASYYSNSIVVGGERILIQASDAYERGKVNVKHWWIDFK